ncbi:NAD(P)-dependent oxidoreductase [uncultured Friedmanniella sp.]|uniref:NAD(P)-dependent oxidoreductase n=1 Tax=uncultured Friedmanniella sp. TaxID=335381 RepID=UPI0035CB21CF
MSTVTLLGATGRTGRLVAAELRRRGHAVVVVVRDADRAPAADRVVVGDVRDPAVLEQAVDGVDAVISALGPVKGEPHLHRDLAAALVPVLERQGVPRYVGVSGAGVTLAEDRKSRRDRAISAVMVVVGRATVADKAAEIAAWAQSDVVWTLVRPPRLGDGPATGRVEHHAHTSPRSTAITRVDLAAFLVDCLEQDLYPRQAPLVADRT